MTASTVNADETFTVRGTIYTITQDHSTGFWSISAPVQSDTAGNELYGEFTSRDLLKREIERVG